jgi:ZIP family zinc transporter/zinc and cadmium transporter
VTRAELLYAIAAAGANVLGAVAVISRARWSLRALDLTLSLAAGFLISVVMLDLFPEAVQRGGSRAALIALVAYVLVHLAQHSLGQHFHFGEETHEVSELISISALVGLLLHTFADGVAVASGLRVSTSLGTLVFLAVLLHKFPEGLAISSLFLAAGAGRVRALLAAAALGAATFLGVVLTEDLAFLQTNGLAIASGVTLYVGASNLVPEFQRKRGWSIPVSFLLGCGLYLLARSVAARAA